MKPSLRSAMQLLRVTSWVPFRVLWKQIWAFLIGYFNAFNDGRGKIPGTYVSEKVSESGRICSRNKSSLNLSWFPSPPHTHPWPPLLSFTFFPFPPLSSISANLSDTFRCQLPRYFPLNVTWQQLAGTFELLSMSYAKKKKKLEDNDCWNAWFKAKSKFFQWGMRGNLF